MIYVIIVEDKPSGLEEHVQRMVDQGWYPQGGVSIAMTYDQRRGCDQTVTQAMVKPEPSFWRRIIGKSKNDK